MMRSRVALRRIGVGSRSTYSQRFARIWAVLAMKLANFLFPEWLAANEELSKWNVMSLAGVRP
jgi:hypothetical protein